MALKRTPMEDPPSASSSSSEEDSEEIEDQTLEEESKEIAESEEEGSVEEEDPEEEEEEEEETPSVQKHSPSETPQTMSDWDSEGSDSENQRSPTASDFTIKPIVSKPMDDSAKTKKPTSASSPTKRPAGNEKNGKESQRKKIKVSNGDMDGTVEERKSPIQRLWSEDDEIVILNGMIDYQAKKGADPNADMGEFHDFIKKSLNVDVSKNQLVDKVRRLKKKYRTNAEKGESPVFSKPHDDKSFELSKKIWGVRENNAADGNAKSANKRPRKSVKVSNSSPLPNENGREVALQEGFRGKFKDMKVEKEDFWSMYPLLKRSLELEESKYWSPMPEKNFMKEGMIRIGSAKAKELEEKWNNLRVEEVSMYLKRTELIQELTKLVLDSMNFSKS